MASPPTCANTGGSRGLRPRTPLAVAVAVVAASVLIGISLGPQRSPATAQPTAPPVPAPLVGFSAGSIAGGAPAAGQVTSVGSVRAAAQSGYDRFVIDLGQSPLQQYEVRTQA